MSSRLRRGKGSIPCEHICTQGTANNVAYSRDPVKTNALLYSMSGLTKVGDVVAVW